MRRGRWNRGRVLALTAAGVLLCLGSAVAQFYRGERERWLKNATVTTLSRYVDEYPADAEARFQLAYRLTSLGRGREAVDHLQKLVRRSPNEASYWFGLARAAAVAGEFEESLAAYRKTLELNPQGVIAHYEMAQLLAEAGLITDALREFEAASRLGKPAEAAVASWARCLFRAGRPREAWEMLCRSIREFPMQDEPFILLGRLAEALGERETAERLLRERIDRLRAYPSGVARAPLARLLVIRGRGPQDLAEAERLARRAVEDPSPRAEYHAALGLVLLRKGDLRGAEEALQRGLRLDPRHNECLRLLADVRMRQGRKAAAEALRARVRLPLAVDPRFRSAWQAATRSADAAAYLELATELEAAGRPADAAEVCLRGLRHAPDHRELNALLAQCRMEAIRTMAAPRHSSQTKFDLYPWAE